MLVVQMKERMLNQVLFLLIIYVPYRLTGSDLSVEYLGVPGTTHSQGPLAAV